MPLDPRHPFIGYEYGGPCPARPWWQWAARREHFRRTDGLIVRLRSCPTTSDTIAELFMGSDTVAEEQHEVMRHPLDTPFPLDTVFASVDGEYPMPAPEPCLSQVWVDVDGEPWRFAGFVVRGDGKTRDVGRPWRWLHRHGEAPKALVMRNWPDPGSVLVEGRGAPWAGPTYDPDLYTDSFSRPGAPRLNAQRPTKATFYSGQLGLPYTAPQTPE